MIDKSPEDISNKILREFPHLKKIIQNDYPESKLHTDGINLSYIRHTNAFKVEVLDKDRYEYCGIIDKSGKWKLKAKYDWMTHGGFNEHGIIEVVDGKKKGLLDKNFKFILPLDTYENILFQNDYIMVIVDSLYADAYDFKGNLIFSNKDVCPDHRLICLSVKYKAAVVAEDSCFLIITMSGKQLIPEGIFLSHIVYLDDSINNGGDKVYFSPFLNDVSVCDRAIIYDLKTRKLKPSKKVLKRLFDHKGLPEYVKRFL